MLTHKHPLLFGHAGLFAVLVGTLSNSACSAGSKSKFSQTTVPSRQLCSDISSADCASDGWCRLQHVGAWIASLSSSEYGDTYVLTVRGKVLQLRGAQWVDTGLEAESNISDIWGRGEKELIAVGWSGAAFHYDGHRWLQKPTPTKNVLRSIWASGDHVYAVGDFGTVLQYKHRKWINHPRAASDHLEAVSGSPTGHVVAIGGEQLVKYNGRRWSARSFRKGVIRDVWMVIPSETYAVGDRGTIARSDGSRWVVLTGGAPPGLGVGSQASKPSIGSNLKAVAVRRSLAVAVGTSGMVVHYQRGDIHPRQINEKLNFIDVNPYGSTGWMIAAEDGSVFCRDD